MVVGEVNVSFMHGNMYRSLRHDPPVSSCRQCLMLFLRNRQGQDLQDSESVVVVADVIVVEDEIDERVVVDTVVDVVEHVPQEIRHSSAT